MAYYNVKSGSTVYLDLLPVKNEIDAGKLLKSVTAFWATSGARRYISGSYGPGPGPGVGSGPGSGSGTGGSGSNKSSVIGDDIGEVDDDRGRSRDKDNDNRYDNVNNAGSNVNRVDINTTSNITESNTCAAVDDSNSSRSVSNSSSLRDRERNSGQNIVADAILNSTISNLVSTSMSALAVNVDTESCVEQFEECAENDDFDNYDD